MVKTWIKNRPQSFCAGRRTKTLVKKEVPDGCREITCLHLGFWSKPSKRIVALTFWFFCVKTKEQEKERFIRQKKISYIFCLG
jgi:hypothetical protein